MKKSVYSLLSTVLVSLAVSVTSAQTPAPQVMSGSNPRPQVMSGSNPRPQVMSGSNPRPQSTQSTTGSLWTAFLAFFGIATN